MGIIHSKASIQAWWHVPYGPEPWVYSEFVAPFMILGHLVGVFILITENSYLAWRDNVLRPNYIKGWYTFYIRWCAHYCAQIFVLNLTFVYLETTERYHKIWLKPFQTFSECLFSPELYSSLEGSSLRELHPQWLYKRRILNFFCHMKLRFK